MEAVRGLKAEVVGKTKKVMHNLKDDLEEVVEEALSKRRSTITTTRTLSDGSTLTTVSSVSSETTSSSSGGDADASAAFDTVNEPVNEETKGTDNNQDSVIYLDKNEDIWKCRQCTWTHRNRIPWNDDQIHPKPYDFDSGGSEIQSSQFNGEVGDLVAASVKGLLGTPLGETSAGPSKTEVQTAATSEEEGYYDEELVELEFETAVHKMHSHSDYKMLCPYCDKQITKVTLRRRIRRPGIPSPQHVPGPEGLVGCLSCFSVFSVSGNRLNPFRCFGADTGLELPREHPCNRLNPFRCFGADIPPPQEQPGDVIIPVDQSTPQGTETPQTTLTPPGATPPPIVPEPGSSTSLEIVKSVVYGGLMESMASLSVVSSAAASDATTLNIVVLGLANLVGGLVVLAHNLKDLRYGDSGQTSPETEEKYKKELGKKEHFPLHAVVAVLSYIIFGLLPPVVYGATFRETNDRDLKMLAVAAASLLCIFLLAICKTYARGEHNFKAYFKTVSYYITGAVAASGVAFAVGDLTEKLVRELGWLEPGTVTPPHQLFHQPNSLFQPTWASSY